MVSGVQVPSIVPLRVKGNLLDDGKSKFDIDTSTPIELQSSDTKCEIFYTTNGASPEPKQRGLLAKFTTKYDKPFYLPKGKFLVKAVAVNPEGQESSVNAKLFRVSQGERQDRDTSVDDSLKFIRDLHGINSNYVEVEANHSLFSRDQMGSSSIARELMTSRQNFIPADHRDFSIGSFCNACGFNELRGSKFCSNCGAQLVPYDVPKTSRELRRDVPLRNHPSRATVSAACRRCKANLQGQACYCHVCGSFQDFDAKTVVGNVSGWPNNESKFCSTCGCENSALDLYCFKCGLDLGSVAPPAVTKFASTVTCTLCCKDNPENSRFCLSCGSLLIGSVVKMDRSDKDLAYKTGIHSVQASWEPVSIPMAKITLRNSVATQTAPFFYPTASERYSDRRTAQIEAKILKKKTGKPQIEESAGNGYWGANVEFIKTAIDKNVEKSTENRAKLSQVKLRDLEKMEIDQTSKVVHVSLTFAVAKDEKDKKAAKEKNKKDNKEGKESKSVEKSGKVSSSREKKRDVSTSSSSSDSSDSSKHAAKSTKSKSEGPGRNSSSKSRTSASKSERTASAQSVNPLARLLIEAIKNGDEKELIKQYLDEGVDINTKDVNGDSLVAVAVRSGNYKIIPDLVQKHGADVDCSSKGSTPLHLAVTEDDPDIQVVKALLDCRANVNKKDARGKTALQVAKDLGVDEKIIKLLKAVSERPGSAAISSRPGKYTKDSANYSSGLTEF